MLEILKQLNREIATTLKNFRYQSDSYSPTGVNYVLKGFWVGCVLNKVNGKIDCLTYFFNVFCAKIDDVSER